MNWTKERPTKAGWYWYQGPHEQSEPEVLAVEFDDEFDRFVQFGVGPQAWVDECNGQWAGPLEPPP